MREYTSLSIVRKTSKARDTYGMLRLEGHSFEYEKPLVVTGMGFDMLGTLVGRYLTKVYGDRIQEVLPKLVQEKPYGLYTKPDGTWYLEGACGFDCMIHIAELTGLRVYKTHNRDGNITGFVFVG